jgi:hypothetical protein
VRRSRGGPRSQITGDFVKAIRTGNRMEFHTAIARSVVRIVEAADESFGLGGNEVRLRTTTSAPSWRLAASSPRYDRSLSATQVSTAAHSLW